MPTSHWQQINEIVGLIVGTRPRSLLDIGVGFGKFGVLAREYLELWDGREVYADWKCRIDGIEVFKSYKNSIYDVYDNVYFGGATQVLQNLKYFYDLTLLIDVLEHFEKEDGKILLKYVMRRSRNMIISTPINPSPQKNTFGNEYETHRSKWRVSDIPGKKFVVSNHKSLICFSGEDTQKVLKYMLNFGIKVESC